jgi:hypothetical protein
MKISIDLSFVMRRYNPNFHELINVCFVPKAIIGLLINISSLALPEIDHSDPIELRVDA